MDLKRLFMNNKAVSPVIGVILMVAITVILAAAIGASVFGQGTAQSSPKANLDIQAGSTYYFKSNVYHPATVKIEHIGGDPINFDSESTKIMVLINGTAPTKTVDASSIKKDLDVLSVGNVKTLKLNEEDGTTDDGTAIQAITSGSIVDIKIVDKKTDQLICDKTVRF